mgnify:CR=1 FL=1
MVYNKKTRCFNISFFIIIPLFCNLQDGTDNIQIYVRRDDVGEAEYAGFKKWDIGDIIGIEGYVFKTKTEEISDYLCYTDVKRGGIV